MIVSFSSIIGSTYMARVGYIIGTSIYSSILIE
nr:MAG TPA: hypothetical protein [Caudoviricetes sp.]